MRTAIVHNFPTSYRLPLFELFSNEENYEVKVFFTGGSPAHRKDRQTKDSTVQWEILPGIALKIFGSGQDSMNINLDIRPIISFGPDVVLIYGYLDWTSYFVALWCRLRRIPYLLFAEVTYNSSSLSSLLIRPFVRALSHGASGIGAGSNNTADYFRKLGTPPEKIHLVRCIPDLDSLRTEIQQRKDMLSNLRSTLGVQNKIVVLYIGRLTNSKGLFDLIEAFSITKQHRNDLQLVICGTGPLIEQVKIKAHEVNPVDINVLGFVPRERLVDWLSVTDVHIMPSWSEALGLVVLEALASGIPSITTSTSGAEEFIKEGINGYIVPPRNPEALAKAILAAVEDPVRLKRMKEAAMHSVEGINYREVLHQLENAINIAIHSSFRGG